MKAKVLILSVACCLFGQTEGVAPKKNPNPAQVTVSGNHPDALNNESTVIFDNTKNISYIYDQIRMVDDINYPNAYLDIGDYRLEFSRAKLGYEEIIADVKIRKKQ